MLFGIEADLGTAVVGYCVPDSFSASPLLCVCVAGRDPLVFEADERRDALIAAGRHETGRCGFTLDATMVPGFAATDGLEIRDMATGLAIYRRGASFDSQAGAFFRLETHLRPLRAIDAAFQGRIAAAYCGIERYNRETITQIFCLDRKAIYASGRLDYRAIEAHLATSFRLAIVLQDPHVELAERLIVLRDGIDAVADRLGPQERTALAPVAAFAARLDQVGQAGLKQAFRHISRDVAFALGNPLLRQLTSHATSSAQASRALPMALNLLAQFDVVAVRADGAACAEAFGAWLDRDLDEAAIAPPSAEVGRLSARLRDIPHCTALIDADLELYRQVALACQAAADQHVSRLRAS